jgi:hypothetical protein
MPINLPPFPDAEDVVMALLEEVADTTTDTAATLDSDAPVIKVTRVGGTDDLITDRPLVEVAVFATTYEQARQLARQCQQVILASGGRSIVTPDHPQGVLIDKAETTSAPLRVPYENENLRHKAATYQFSFRRPRQL